MTMFYIGITMLLMLSAYLIYYAYKLMGWNAFKKDVLIPAAVVAWVVLALILIAMA